MLNPVRFTDSVETAAPDEPETQRQLVDTLSNVIRKMHADTGHAPRSVHAKSHALLSATFEVLPGLDAAYAQGLFATPHTYDAVMRVSTTPGDILPDNVSTPRGIAIKVIGVDGDRVAGAEPARTQDFVMAEGKAFGVATPADFLKQLKLVASTTDRGEAFKQVVSAVFRVSERAIEGLGGESGTLKALGGNRNSQPLSVEVYGQAPIRYGDFIAKFGLVPVSSELVALKGKEIALHGRENALRDELNAFLASHGAEWELRVQLCIDLSTMPIEDASVAWPETASPYVAVARVRVAPQAAWTDARARMVDDEMSFSPWHALAAHRPLGGIMRARRPAYRESVALRSRLNGCPIHEPSTAPPL